MCRPIVDSIKIRDNKIEIPQIIYMVIQYISNNKMTI